MIRSYESQLRKPVRGTQAGGNRTGKFLAPATKFGIAARNRTRSLSAITPLVE